LSEPFHLAVDGLPDEWVVKQITVNDTDALDGVVDLSPGQQAVARIVLTDRVTEVAGVVPTVDQTRPAVIVVFPENSAQWGYRSRSVRRAEADARGNFRIVGLPPGERYLAFATDYLEDGEHLDPEFLTGFRTLAVPFSLAEAERRMLDLEMVER
jgi:hypothetical protein